MTARPQATILSDMTLPFSPPWRSAVIDIGSNSVRLVVYEGARRAPLTIFNEKVICGLGAKIRSTGKLDPKGVALATENLPRFKAAAEATGAAEIHVFATSAVRDATDGSSFVKRVRRETGLTIQVLSGDEEARLSGMGLLSGVPDADGVVGDLGGGSLELINLRAGRIVDTVTLPIGALQLNEFREQGDSVGGLLKEQLESVPWLRDLKGRTFYAIGGAWRALARIHMAQHPGRLQIIDAYKVPAGEMGEMARLISRQSDMALLKAQSFSSRRLNTIRPSARVLRNVIRLGRPDIVEFSARGVREGVLFDALGALARRDDPLLASAEQIAVRFGRFASLGLPLADWTDPLFADEPPEETRLRHAVCLLSDLGWIDHPDHRAIHGFSRLLTLPVQGLDHPGRAYLAHAIHARFGGATEEEHLAVAEHAGLEPEALMRARAVGAALRLGFSISAGRADFLRATFIKREGGQLVLHLPEASGTYRGDALASRHGALAKLLGLKPRVDVAGQGANGGADGGAEEGADGTEG